MITRVTNLILSYCRRKRLTPYWVGGPVRDHLLGRPCHDWDLVCPQAKNVAHHIARSLRAKVITLDEHFQIYRIVIKRKDQDDFTVDFAEQVGRTIEADLGRRDFTINAMAMPLDQENGHFTIIDPFQGQRDLKAKTIRAVSSKGLEEDPLRLLRAFRFSTQFGFHIERQTKAWIKAKAPLLAESPARLRGKTMVARERVREEVLKLFGQLNASSSLQEMDACGLLTILIPEMEAGRRIAVNFYGRGGVVRHALETVANLEWILAPRSLAEWRLIPDQVIQRHIQNYIRAPMGGHPRSAFLKFGALLHDIGKPATAEMRGGRLRFFAHEEVGAQMASKTMKEFRCSRQESMLVRGWIRNHMRPGNLAAAAHVTPKAFARFFRDMGEEGVGMLLISLADHYTYLPRTQWGKMKDPVEKITRHLLQIYYKERERVLPQRLVDGHQLMKYLRLKPGPVVGQLLELLQDAQAEGHITTAKEALIYAKRKFPALRRQPAPS